MVFSSGLFCMFLMFLMDLLNSIMRRLDVPSIYIGTRSISQDSQVSRKSLEPQYYSSFTSIASSQPPPFMQNMSTAIRHLSFAIPHHTSFSISFRANIPQSAFAKEALLISQSGRGFEFGCIQISFQCIGLKDRDRCMAWYLRTLRSLNVLRCLDIHTLLTLCKRLTVVV